MNLIEISKGVFVNPMHVTGAIAVMNSEQKAGYRIYTVDGEWRAVTENEYAAFLSALYQPKRILITVEGGVIQDICDIPKGVEVEVRDFDVEGTEAAKLKKSENGDEYIESIWG